VSKRILIVEDNDASRTALAELLREEGYEVREAPTGRDAITGYERWSPDAVLLDYTLPDTTAPALLQKFTECPVIMVTGSAELRTGTGLQLDDHEAECLAMGAVAHVPKPVNLDTLLSLLAEALE
jgi:CheY-like chemotaxis protein